MQWKDTGNHWKKEEGSGGGAISSKMKGKLMSAFKRPADHGESEEDTALRTERALQMLQGARFFKDLDRELLKALPEHAYFIKEPKGHVLFRQGDPPKNCYVVVTGSVSFWIGQGGGGGASPREPASPNTDGIKIPPHDFLRVKSGEEFSTFSLKSDLGRYIRAAKHGEVFGELAFINDDHRKATARCADDCELLCIPAKAFALVKQMVKEREKQKRKFLELWVPGMAGIPEPGPKDPTHPAMVFFRYTFPEGHVFIRQGFLHVSEFYVITVGEVAVTRKHPNQSGKTYREVLHPGTMFGPLLRLSSKEPFTYQVASESCEVFRVKGRDFWQLPSSVLDGVMHRLSSDTADRLRQCCIVQPNGWETQQLFASHYRPRSAVASQLMNMNSREMKTLAMDVHFWDKSHVMSF